jgi:hypothetical protein
MTPSLAAVREVPFQIFDFTATPPEGFEPGFYFDVPLAPTDKIHAAELFLDGPHETHAKALDAARDFIIDALTNHNTGTTE